MINVSRTLQVTFIASAADLAVRSSSRIRSPRLHRRSGRRLSICLSGNTRLALQVMLYFNRRYGI